MATTLQDQARDYVEAFVAEFGAAPDLSDPSDAEHATTACPAGVSWEAWRAAVEAAS